MTMLRTLKTGAVLALMTFSVPSALAGTNDDTAMKQEVSMDEVQMKISKTFDAIANYSVEQRDEAVESISKSLQEVDHEIDLLETRARNEWADMTNEAKQETAEALREVRKQRNLLGEKFGALQEGTEGAWDNLKVGIADAWQSLKTAWKNAVGAENS